MNRDEYVGMERADNGVTTLTLRAGGRMPVVSLQSATALAEHFEALAQDAQTRVILLRGEGGHFCAGGDIAAIRDALPDPDRLLAPIIDQLHRGMRAIQRLPQPVVASVAGSAAGGGFSLAMACDLIVAAANARFVAGYPSLGTSSDGGLSYTLTRRVGAMRAMDILLVRGLLDAAEAQALGLVARVVEPAQLEAASADYAATLARQPPQVLREFKALIGQAEGHRLSEQLDAERAAFLRCAKTADFAGRVQRFLERRR